MKFLRLGAEGAKEVSGRFLKIGASLGRGSAECFFAEMVLIEGCDFSIPVLSNLLDDFD